MVSFDLSGKKAVVTGGSRGLGRGMAEGLHEAGAEVALIDVLDSVLDTANEIGQDGPKVHAVIGNLLDRDDLKRSFNEAVEKLGGTVDILINNAGTHVRKSCFDHTEDDLDRIMELNSIVPFLLCKLAGEIMVKKGKGKIINIASMLSFLGGVNGSTYSMTKGAVAQLTKSLSNEWVSKGVNVNAIAPGYFDTQLNAAMTPEFAKTVNMRIPIGRWGTLEDIKGIAVFLSSPASDYISGAIIPVDGGFLAR